MTVAEVVAKFGLQPHPEGGYYRETYRSPKTVVLDDGRSRSLTTAILFLLEPGDMSAFHVVQSDELWFFHGGGPLRLHLLSPDGEHATRLVGSPDQEAEPQVLVPSGVYQAATPETEAWSLCGCVVSPGFSFDDFDMPSREKMLRLFPSHEELIYGYTRV